MSLFHCRKDGSLVEVEISITGTCIAGQNVVIAICREISERKRVEQYLAHPYDLMRYVIEHVNAAVAVHDKNFRYMYGSQIYLDQYHIHDKKVMAGIITRSSRICPRSGGMRIKKY